MYHSPIEPVEQQPVHSLQLVLPQLVSMLVLSGVGQFLPLLRGRTFLQTRPVKCQAWVQENTTHYTAAQHTAAQLHCCTHSHCDCAADREDWPASHPVEWQWAALAWTTAAGRIQMFFSFLVVCRLYSPCVHSPEELSGPPQTL